MKKTHIALSLILIFLSMDQTYGFVENRLQWWQVRLQKLEDEKALVQKNSGLDSRILGIIDNEIGRARAIMDVFEREMNKVGSLTHRTRVMTETDIAADVRTVVPPLCALRLLELMVCAAGNDASAAAAHEAVERRLGGLIKRHFGADGPELARRIMGEDIAPNDWKVLAVEVRAGSVISSRRRFEEQALGNITAAVAARLREKNNSANGRELRSMTVTAALEYLRGRDLPDLTRAGDDALAASWSWRRIESILERDFAGYKKVMALLGKCEGVPLERIRLYHRNPVELEPILFRTEPSDPQPAHNPEAKGAGRGGAAPAMEIPAFPPASAVLEEIGKIRKAALLSVTGREDRKFFDDLDASMSAVIKRRSEGAKNVFFREEERVRLLGKKEGACPAVSNEREFNEARKIFNERIATFNECRTNSLRVIMTASEGKKLAADEITARYRYHLQRDGEYLRFTRDLAAASAPVSAIGAPPEHKRFGLCLNGISSLFRFVGSGLVVDRDDRPLLSKNDISVIRGLTAEFAGSVQALRSDIRNSWAQYGRSRSSAEGAEKTGSGHLKEKIAQDDIDAQRAHASECAALYETFGYGEEMISRYAERYASFLKEARTGAVSPGLEYAAKMNSLLGSIDGYDGVRINRELATKRYLQKETKTALSRLQTLLQFYRKNGVRVADAPPQEEITALEHRLGPSPQARIDSWTMNESNIPEIDAKAAKKLSMMMHHKEFTRDKKTAGGAELQGGGARTVTIQDPELSFTIPRGWEEETVGQTESYQGVVKSFNPGGGCPSIKLVRLPMESDDMKETAENWVRKSGCTPVEKRWVKGPENEYLWIIAKDSDKNISETCSVSRDGFTVLVTGRASRDRYPKFKAQIRKIIDSIN
jgi:hypothetical protein